jgi:hypothetical protein
MTRQREIGRHKTVGDVDRRGPRATMGYMTHENAHAAGRACAERGGAVWENPCESVNSAKSHGSAWRRGYLEVRSVTEDRER